MTMYTKKEKLQAKDVLPDINARRPPIGPKKMSFFPGDLGL